MSSPTSVFFLGSHPALSAAELAAYADRSGCRARWDLSRLPVILLGEGDFLAPTDMQRALGGTTMIGTLRATLDHWPTPEDILREVPEVAELRQGKRLIGLSALALNPNGTRGPGLSSPGDASRVAGRASSDRTRQIRELAMSLKRTIGMKGTRVVFPGAKRSDLSTAQLFHNRLPRDGTALFFLVAPKRVDLVTVDAIQDIEAYARRDRGRPHADPGTGMLPPKVAQMLINLSLGPPASATRPSSSRSEATAGRPGGTIYDPFCGVGTIPMEALLMGLTVAASDASPKQVERTRENLGWLSRVFQDSGLMAQNSKVFVHDIAKALPPVDRGSIDAIATEGWLGPPLRHSPSPKEINRIAAEVLGLLLALLQHALPLLRPGGCLVLTVPAFRVGKRLLHFPIEDIRVRGWARESLVSDAWMSHPLFREAARGTLLYGRPDAIVLREIVRFRKV